MQQKETTQANSGYSYMLNCNQSAGGFVAGSIVHVILQQGTSRSEDNTNSEVFYARCEQNTLGITFQCSSRECVMFCKQSRKGLGKQRSYEDRSTE